MICYSILSKCGLCSINQTSIQKQLLVDGFNPFETYTLQGTNISPPKALLKMIFPFSIHLPQLSGWSTPSLSAKTVLRWIVPSPSSATFVASSAPHQPDSSDSTKRDLSRSRFVWNKTKPTYNKPKDSTTKVSSDSTTSGDHDSTSFLWRFLVFKTSYNLSWRSQHLDTIILDIPWCSFGVMPNGCLKYHHVCWIILH